MRRCPAVETASEKGVQLASKTVTVQRGITIPMRDGLELVADLYLPPTDGPYPTLLQRTPYHRQSSPAFPLLAAERGFAVVMQDTRGRYDSPGIFRPFVHEADDGHDTCAWIIGQSWSNGRIGMFGGSYVGLTQWQAALAQSPGLEAISPAITASDYHDGWAYQGGAYELGFNVSWSMGLAQDTAFRLDRDQPGRDLVEQARDRSDNLHALLNRIPLAGDPLADEIAPYYDNDWLAHPDDDSFWQALKVGGRYGELDLACFHSGGWYDIFLGGTLRNYTGMRTGAKTERARNRQWLLINPRDHYTFSSHLPMGNYDPGIRSHHGTIDFDGMQLRFFDHVLRDADNGWDEGDHVRIFVMGPDTWRTEPDWPIARAQETTWYLHSTGQANTRDGNGILSTVPPADEPSDTYRYDPLNPVPTTGGPLCGHPFALKWGRHDQRAVESRSDVLCFTSAELETAIEISGQITVTLFASSSAPDTDFTAKLVDVLPDGTANNIIDGIIRARYRHGPDRQVLLDDGEIAELMIDLTSTSAVFDAGHRIRLEISSSNFPRFDRNPNHGGEIASATESDYRPADQTIYHDTTRPSRITLPIIPPIT